MTGSYPDRQNYSEKQRLLCIQGARRVLPINLGQSSQDSKISQMPNNQRHTSQVDFKLLPDQSGAIKSRFRESLKDAKTIRGMHPRRYESISNQHGALSWAYDYEGHDAHSAHLIKSSRGESFQSP